MDYELIFLKSLLLTVIIEMAILFILSWFFSDRKGVRLSRLLMTGFLASFATLPYLWFVLPVFISDKVWYIVVGETFAVVVESFIIFSMLRIKYSKSLIFSIVCNAVSFLVGIMTNWR